ncbi:MAG: polysaccharide pyruvyl transferase family protein [Planctomycetes bacterium]|nr:polysaccharide pyruvyl transferase family protein [Planctomycetota bacterium]
MKPPNVGPGTSRVSRRRFCQAASAVAIAGSILPATRARAAAGKPPHILVRSAWQTVNIGDIAHTPGVLKLLEQYLPEAQVSLWPSVVDFGVAELLMKRFPKLTIIAPQDRAAAMQTCDFLLHGSGSGFVAEKDVASWKEKTGKPYGVYGISMTTDAQHTVDLLSGAQFVFFRDSVSLGNARSLGCKSPVMEYGPDAAFACDLHDDAKAEAFLKANGLEQGKFLCCIPRLRYTPYWLIKQGRPFDEAKNARNEEMKEHDHKPLREAVEAIVRNTAMKILLCPEDRTQMAVGRELIYDKLPADVKRRVVWRENYWNTDEAVSTYVRSAGLFGNEMHSPIMCIGHGVPAIVCRWQEQTNKGFMWRDIGLGEWLFTLDDDADLPRVAPAALAMAQDKAAAKAKAAQAREFVERRQRETMAMVRQAVGLT